MSSEIWWDAYAQGSRTFYLAASASGLLYVELNDTWQTFCQAIGRLAPGALLVHHPSAMAPYLAQYREYFQGERTLFSIPLDMRGTPFQLAVWQALLAIPYGSTRSYSDIARAIGRPRASRAVGQANHANPLAIVVPCHRVVGQQGQLTGYGGGLSLKSELLELENRTQAGSATDPQGLSRHRAQ